MNSVYFLEVQIKEVQIVYGLFLVNCYLLHGNIYSETNQIETEVLTIYTGGLVIHLTVHSDD